MNMNFLGLRRVTFFVIRHKATGKVMPQLRNRGYTYWNPSSTNPMNNLVKKDLNTPRLFESYSRASKAIAQWNAQPNARSVVNISYYGSDQEHVDYTPDGRTKDDLEIIKIRLVKI